MNINLIFSIFSNISFFIFFLFTGTFADWHYEKNDKQEWIDEYPECNGVLQSPINIETKNAVFTSTLEPIHFINYDFDLLFNLTNNGHTIVAFQADPIKNVRPFITGSDFGSEIFYLSQFHFHWGYDVSLGSEHHIDNKTFPLEMHLVHLSDSGNITVVSFLFETTPRDNPNLNRLLKLIGEDVFENASSSSYLRLTQILPNVKSANSKGYFRYLGSLTTPPCTEGVIWNVYRETINISIKQLNNFYKNSIKFNYRPVQNLNSRRLFVNAKLKN